MNGVDESPSNKDVIRREASEWVARMESGDLDSIEKRKLNDWISTSLEHKKELTRLVNLWDKMSDIGERSLRTDKVVSNQKSDYLSVLLSFMTSKAFAYSLIILAIPLIMYFQTIAQFTSSNGEYLTKIGEQKSIILADGSEILLNTNSIVEVLYSNNLRNIKLLQGEANFKVAPDKDKPFTVSAGLGNVRALGTSFAVRLDGDKVNVLVSHGTVRVRAVEETLPPDTKINSFEKSKNEVVVSAGNNVIFDEVAVESVEQKSEQVLSKNLSWKDGFLAFDNEPLSEVFAEMSRYTSLDIVIADENIRDMRVGGYYPINNLDTVFSSLELNLGLKVEKINGQYYYITQPNS